MMAVAGGEVQSGLSLNFAVSLATKSARRRRIDQGSGGKDESGKVENRETRSRIAQDIFDHGWDQDGYRMGPRHRSFAFNPDWIREIRG
jgi:hypothetical protein